MTMRVGRFVSGIHFFGVMFVAGIVSSDGLSQTAAAVEKSPLRSSSLTPTEVELSQVRPDDFAVADVNGRAGQKIPLNIASEPNAPPEDLFTISGLPPEAKLTVGSAYDDLWLVRRRELPLLSLLTPEGFSRSIQIAITRARSANRPPLTLIMNISVSGIPVATTAPAQVPPKEKVASAYVRTKEETQLFETAREKFKKGDVSGARAVFEYFAMKGDPEAAIAMAETYDPVILGQLYIRGLQPDEAKAAAWYQKAMQLGDAMAKTRLNALNKK